MNVVREIVPQIDDTILLESDNNGRLWHLCPSCPFASVSARSAYCHNKRCTKQPYHPLRCPALPDGGFLCKSCGFVARRIANLREHARLRQCNGAKVQKCVRCFEIFPDRAKLREHIVVHRSELKSFSCSLCDFKCRTSTHLRYHMRVHLNVRPYKCYSCDYSSRQLCTLKRHIAGRHLKIKNKPLKKKNNQ